MASEINTTQGLCCTVCDCTGFLLPSETLVTEWLRSVTETPGPLVGAISWLPVSAAASVPAATPAS